MSENIPQRLLDQKKRLHTERPNKAVAYIRVSDGSQVDGESLDTQKARIQQYADSNGLEIVKWFGDEGKSGKTVKQRDDMLEMLKFCAQQKRKIGYAIFYKLQRASRDALSYYADFRTVLAGLGMAVRSATEHIEDTPSGRFMEGVLVLNGQLDNEIKAGNTSDNMKSLARQGWWQHGNLVGFDLVKIGVGDKRKRPTLKQNRDARAVGELFETYARGGFTQADIKRQAREKGLKNQNSKYIDDNAIYRMLTQPAYAGYICSKHTDFEMYEGKHIDEAIVSLETFQRVQQILNAQSRNRTGIKVILPNELYPLKRFILCFNCNNPMYASSPQTGGGKSHSPRYHCARTSCRGIVPSVKASTANSLFSELLKSMQPNDATLKLYKEILNRTSMKQLDNFNRRLSTLRADLSGLDEERSVAMRRWNKGEMTDQEKDEIIATVEADKFEKKEQIAAMEDRQAVKQSHIDYAMNFMHDAHKLWLDADVTRRQRFQKAIFPEGVILDTRNMHFGTEKISPLYRYAGNKNDLSVTEKSRLVTSRGIEPRLPG